MAWLVVLTGACGSGKSTVGRALAEKERAMFIEGDDFHTPDSVSKMAKGQPLTDQDRQPWLGAVHGALHETASHWSEGRVRGVLACSALKKNYRDIILGRGKGARDLSGKSVVVQLTASAEVLQSRVAERSGHFMPPSLVSTQLALLEPLSPEEWPCLTCPALGSTTSIVETIEQFIISLIQPLQRRS